MAPAVTYTKNYQVHPALSLFYTGGPAQLFPDGECVACACNDEVKVVNISDGSLKTTLPGDTEAISALAISPDGNSIFAASRSLSIKHWNVASASTIRTWKAHESPVSDMAMDSSGGLLATASVDRAIFVWDVEGGYCTHAFRGHTGIVTTVMFHPNTHRLQLFSASDDSTVRVWDLVTKRCVKVLEKHFSTVTSLAVSTNGWTLLSAGRDKVVNVWNLRDNSLLSTVPVYESLESICIVPDKSSLPGGGHPNEQVTKTVAAPLKFLTAGERGVLRIWKTDGAVCLYEEKSSQATGAHEKLDKDSFVSATLLPAANGVMAVTADQRLLFYESVKADNGSAQLNLTKRLIGRQDEIIDLKFVGQEQNVLAVAINIEQVRLYDLATMTCLQELVGHTDIVLSLDSVVSSSGRAFLASAGKDHTLRVWDVETGTCIAVATGHMAAIGAIAFARKNVNFIVTGSSDNTVKLWNLEGVLDSPSAETPSKLSTKAVIAAHEKDINSVAVAPNDALLCTGSQDRTACIWKLPSLALLTTLRGHKRGVWAVEFSPVDQAVLTASADRTIRIWAIADGSCLRTFEGHTAGVLRAAFISRGTQIVSTGTDGILKLWTVKTSECINTFDKHEGKIWALDISKTTGVLATGASDSLVNIWIDCTQADEEEAAQKEADEVLKGQYLANALADVDYVKAVQLAFELKRPMKLLEVFKEMFSKREMDEELQRVIKGLGKEHFRLLLEYVREWNTKSKFCHIAQRLMRSVVSLTPATELLELPGLRELLEGILPYTQRHFSRIDRLSRSTFLLDYTLSSMSVLMALESPGAESVKVKEQSAETTTTTTVLQEQPEIAMVDANHTENDVAPISTENGDGTGSTGKGRTKRKQKEANFEAGGQLTPVPTVTKRKHKKSALEPQTV